MNKYTVISIQGGIEFYFQSQKITTNYQGENDDFNVEFRA